MYGIVYPDCFLQLVSSFATDKPLRQVYEAVWCEQMCCRLWLRKRQEAQMWGGTSINFADAKENNVRWFVLLGDVFTIIWIAFSIVG